MPVAIASAVRAIPRASRSLVEAGLKPGFMASSGRRLLGSARPFVGSRLASCRAGDRRRCRARAGRRGRQPSDRPQWRSRWRRGRSAARRSMPVQRGMLIAIRRVYPESEGRCKSWWKKWRLSDESDEESDDEAVAIARPVRTMPTAISSCLLKLASSRASRASDSWKPICMRRAGGPRRFRARAGRRGRQPSDRPRWRSRWRRGQERRLDGACRSNGGCLIAMREVYPKFERRRKSWREPPRVGGRQLVSRAKFAQGEAQV